MNTSFFLRCSKGFVLSWHAQSTATETKICSNRGSGIITPTKLGLLFETTSDVDLNKSKSGHRDVTQSYAISGVHPRVPQYAEWRGFKIETLQSSS